jgi:hypothetical protein
MVLARMLGNHRVGFNTFVVKEADFRPDDNLAILRVVSPGNGELAISAGFGVRSFAFLGVVMASETSVVEIQVVS